MLETPLYLKKDVPYESSSIETNVFALKMSNPEIYVQKLKELQRHEERRKFCYHSILNYSIFIHEYLEPFYKHLRRLKKLTQGSKTVLVEKQITGANKSQIQVAKTNWDYTGELND